MKHCIKASLEPKLTGLWWYNPLSFNLFIFSFPLRLFVCSHDFGCCLSSGGMYTCSSQMLVHFSALRCFWWSTMLFVLSHFFFIHLYSNLFLSFVSSLTHLNFRCLSVQSLIESVVCPHSFFYLCGWLLGSHWAHFPPRGLGFGELMLCDHFTEQFDPLFSVCCGGRSLDICFFGSCIIPFFHSVSSTKDFFLDSAK